MVYKAYRKLLAPIVLETEEQFRAKAAQGQCIKWSNLLSLSATYGTLPSPSNLHRWHICSELSCYCCSKAVYATAHILGACMVALQQERFTYCHDSALQAFLTALQTSLSSYSLSESLQYHINFLRPGTRI